MCRKLFVLALIVGIGFMVLRKTEVGSLIRVWWKDSKTSLEASISPETRVKQLRQEIGHVDSRLTKARKEQAKLEVAYEDLQTESTTLKTQQDSREQHLKAMLAALDGDSAKVTFDGKTIDTSDLQKRLDRATTDYNSGKKTLKARSDMLESRKRVIDASDERIRLIADRQLELTVLVEKIEDQLSLMKLKQTEKRTTDEKNELAEAERLLKILETGLREEEKFQEIQVRHGQPSKPEVTRPSLEESKKAARKALEQDE